MSQATAPEAVITQLAPNGVLRAGINMSNFLLVTGKTASGDPDGVSPNVAAEIARRLGVPVTYVTYPTPGALADDADKNAWDIGNIGAEPQRAEQIAFTAAYAEIEATYLVPAGSPIQSLADVDQPGIKISVTGRAAYGLWLQRNIKHAELIKTETLDSSLEAFLSQSLDVLAGLKPRLLTDIKQVPGGRILDGNFSTVQQAVGTPRKNEAAAAWLADFVEEAKASGLIGSFIKTHNVEGLSVAPAA